MVRFKLIALILLIFAWVSAAQGQALGNVNGIGPFVNSNPTSTSQLLGPSFQTPLCSFNSGTLVITCGPGIFYTGGTPILDILLTSNQITLTANQSNCTLPTPTSCNYIYVNSSGTFAASTSYATASANGNSIFALATTGASGVLTLTGTYQLTNIPLNIQTSDGQFTIPPTSCDMFSSVALGAAPTGTTNPGFVRAAAGNVFYQLVGSANAGNVFYECPIIPPWRNTSGKGATINSVQVCAGWQGAAMTGAPTIVFNTRTTGAVGAAASAMTVAAAGGTITTSPATLQTATTTAQQCYEWSATLGTPFAIGSLASPTLSELWMEVQFPVSGTATTVQVGPIVVLYSNVAN